jgi:flotillin
MLVADRELPLPAFSHSIYLQRANHMFEILIPFLLVVVLALAVAGLLVAMMLRRVVPTNMVHIVQSSSSTTPYGRGKASGNSYYAWPTRVPNLGVSIIEFPESIFQINLDAYEAYDQARLPFTVDVSAFFRVELAETAAQRVASFGELQGQLTSVLQGAVRRILHQSLIIFSSDLTNSRWK